MTDRLELQFRAFHRANPRVYELFVRFTQRAIQRGHRNLSADMILHRVRWETAIETHGADEFKINNNFSAFYARMFMRDYPRHDGFFRTRASAADEMFARDAA
jgi:hypothetical protein